MDENKKSDWLEQNNDVSWDYYREEASGSDETDKPSGNEGNGITQEEGESRMANFFKNRKVQVILATVLVVLIALGGGGYWVVSHYLNKIDTGDGYKATDNGSDILEDMNFPTINEVPADQLDGTLKDMILKNYMNGQPISSKNVINVLLIGRDTNNDEEDSRSDAMIIASLNKVTKKITMVSLFRDQYLYIPTSNGGTFSKLNHSHNWGGPELLIKTIENNYKIVIDNYASVNFETFPKIIDALGGVDLEFTKREAAYMQERFHLTVPEGKHHANGKEALAYSRIRKIDSDVKRNERQRTVLISLFNELKTANVKEMKNVLDSALPYVKTGFSKGDLLSLGTQALTKGWTNYEISQYTCPQDEKNYSTATINGLWYWIVDYPAAAHDLQMELYGKSNIVLAQNRPNFKELAINGRGSGSSSSSSSSSNSSGGSSQTTTRSSQNQQEPETETTTEPTTSRPNWWPLPTVTTPKEEPDTPSKPTVTNSNNEDDLE